MHIQILCAYDMHNSYTVTWLRVTCIWMCSDTRSCYAFPKSEESRRFGTFRNCLEGILPKANGRNEPRTRFRRTLKWVSKWQSRSSLVAFSLVPLSPHVGRINIYERHFVPDEVGVYVCEQHRPVGLEVPGAFWNDVVGHGRFGPGAPRIRQRSSLAWFPPYIGSRQLLHYSR